MKYHLYYYVNPYIFSQIISYSDSPCNEFVMSFITYYYLKVVFRAKHVSKQRNLKVIYPSVYEISKTAVTLFFIRAIKANNENIN